MKKSFWITLSIINLFIVALLGLGLRTKILFYIPGINYRDLLSAHSHFAFSGWAGLSLITLLIFNLLPAEKAGRRIYQWLLAGIQISSLGMAFLFPFYGYNIATMFFSTLYIAVVMAFVPVFFKDLRNVPMHRAIKLLSITALLSAVASFAGTLGLVYILSSKSGNSLLYRDSIYTFLHFQYNGFFTTGIFALFFNHLSRNNIVITKNAHRFALFLCLSIVPSLFLSLLWHGSSFMYMLAGAGVILILISLYYFSHFISGLIRTRIYNSSFARNILIFSLVSFFLKMLLNVGTIIPQLGHEIYSNRPVIIGFLHLIFLAFLTFFILSVLLENGYFTKAGKIVRFPVILFSTGIFSNELILMIQGLSILFKINSGLYSWMLWTAAIILFIGALLMVITRLNVIRANKKAMGSMA